ncbi:hypothetical protein B0H14DRAFT_2585109 [Mycena olivaceomarginata]|nr:hypothetical protein B0H14DRAFT_2585109 [Mycena olivaceomarginata]
MASIMSPVTFALRILLSLYLRIHAAFLAIAQEPLSPGSIQFGTPGNSTSTGSQTPRAHIPRSHHVRAESLHNITETLSNLQAFPHAQRSTGLPPPKSPNKTPPAVPCPGVSIEWIPGSIWDSYPYLRHSHRDVGWEPIGFDSSSNRIQLRAGNCQYPFSGGNPQQACISCRT